MKKLLSVSKMAIVAILIIMAIVSSNLNWGKQFWKGIIVSDAKGYYAYLPAIFIYNDLNFGFFDTIEKEKYYNKNWYYDYRSSSDGKVIDKYYCGTALVAELPFFIGAHWLSGLLGFDKDGYSKLYSLSVAVAALFYLFIGLLFVNALLRTYNIKEWERALVLFATVFGTNLFYYTVCEPGVSHVYSFAFVAIFLYCSQKYFTLFQKKYLVILALILGIIVLIRPINGLIIFAWPFMAGSLESFKKGIVTAFKGPWQLLSGSILFLAIVSIQFIIYKISTGHFFVYSYGEEGFNFLHPHLFDILFSYKKGLFLYTPLFLLSLCGVYFLWKSSRFAAYTWLCFFIFITYVLSSWWNWWYGGSFSSRVYVDYLPLFVILLAVALHNIPKRNLKTAFVTAMVLLTFACQIQTYQYRYYQIHWENMTKEKYWDVFFRVDKLVK